MTNNNDIKDRRLSITLKGNPVTKKNSSRIKYIYNKNKRKTVPIIVPSEAYTNYREMCMYQLNSLVHKKGFKAIDYPIRLQCIYYMKDLSLCDISNLINATHDILVDAGVLIDDNWKIVDNIDGTRVKFDEVNPRVEIFIEEVREENSTLWQSQAIIEEREEKIKLEREERERKKENNKKRIAKNVKELRSEGVIWKDVAEIVGVSMSTARKYYNEYYD